MRLTLGAARHTIARIMGVCDSDPRVPQFLNEAVQRLLPRGAWKGTQQVFRTCINQGCITLSRHMETVQAFSICKVPGIVRNELFEFQGNGPGRLGQNDCMGSILIPRGLAVSFDDFTSTTQKAKVYSDGNETPGATILLQGYDALNNWIRTMVNGVIIDGEQVPLSTTPQISVNYFSSLVGVQKPVTNYNVRLYSYDVPSGANVKALSVYEPDETLPQYRRYMIPGLSSMGTSNNTTCPGNVTCDQTQVDLLVKMAFIPVFLDTDYLIIGNLQALKLAVMALLKEEANSFAEAMALWEGQEIDEYGKPTRRQGAIPLLQEELENLNGDGPVATPRVDMSWSMGQIENYA
jgi:hypothetical protein